MTPAERRGLIGHRVETRHRWRAAAIFGAVLAILVGLAGVASATGFDWPGGGTLAESKVIERPDGGFEVFPARCTIFEDGSVRCPDWDGNPGDPEAFALDARLDRLDHAIASFGRVLDYIADSMLTEADLGAAVDRIGESR